MFVYGVDRKSSSNKEITFYSPFKKNFKTQMIVKYYQNHSVNNTKHKKK